MAIHPALRQAVKIFSFLEGDVPKVYKAKRALESLGGKLSPMRPEYEVIDFNVRVFDHEVPLRLFRAPDASCEDLIIFFHGGGWVTGSMDFYDHSCMDLSAQTKQSVLAVDYRLAPEHPFPAGLLDCYNVTQTLLRGESSFDPERITIMGDSAGGNLAAAVSLLSRDAGEHIPKRQILIYPSVAARHERYPSYTLFGEDYLLNAKRLDDYMNLYASKPEDFYDCYFAPILAKDLEQQPDTLIITSDHDVLRDEGEQYGRALLAAGNAVIVYRLDDALHGIFTLPPEIEQVRKCYELINDFFLRKGDIH